MSHTVTRRLVARAERTSVPNTKINIHIAVLMQDKLHDTQCIVMGTLSVCVVKFFVVEITNSPYGLKRIKRIARSGNFYGSFLAPFNPKTLLSRTERQWAQEP